MESDTEARHELEEFRATKDEFMRSPESPLAPEEKEHFTGLSYYPPNDRLRFQLPLNTDIAHDSLTMETSTGGSQEYRRAGTIEFEVDGETARLTIFASHGELFLPMRDSTSSTDTYPAGRYLEPIALDDGTVLVDFNYLYNPYCAYSDHWSCPIPPIENWLRVPIAAGEKRFHP